MPPEQDRPCKELCYLFQVTGFQLDSNYLNTKLLSPKRKESFPKLERHTEPQWERASEITGANLLLWKKAENQGEKSRVPEPTSISSQLGHCWLCLSGSHKLGWVFFPFHPPLWVRFLLIIKRGCWTVSVSFLSPITTLIPNKSNHHHFPSVLFFCLQCFSFPGKSGRFLLGSKAQLQMRLAFPGRQLFSLLCYHLHDLYML